MAMIDSESETTTLDVATEMVGPDYNSGVNSDIVESSQFEGVEGEVPILANLDRDLNSKIKSNKLTNFSET